MKKKHIIAIALLSALVSCEDKRLDGLEPDKIYLPKSGVRVEESFTVGEDATIDLWTYKGSYNGTSCDVSYVVDQNLLDEYNESNGTVYEILAPECYRLSADVVHLDGKQEYGIFNVSYSPEKIVGLCEGAYGIEKYALPLRIESDQVETTDKNSTIIVFRVLEPVVKMLSEKVDVRYSYGDANPVVKTVRFGMDFNSKWECSYALETRPEVLKAALDEYNSAHGTSFPLLDASAYKISSSEGKIAVGDKSVGVDVEFNPSAVHSGRYVLPLILSSVSSPLKVSDSGNTCFVVVDCQGQYVDKADWTVKVSSANPNFGKPEYLIDGKLETYWHPAGRKFSEAIPRDDHPYAVVDMKKRVRVSCVEIDPRKDQFYPQIYSDLRIFISDDGENFTQIGYVAVPWTKVVKCSVDTEPSVGRYVKFSVEYPKNQTSIAFAELSVRGEVME